MPNNRRSKVQRLPKAERRHPSSKIVVLDPATGNLRATPVPGSQAAPNRVAQTSGPVLLQSATGSSAQHQETRPPAFPDAETSRRQASRPPPLHDDILAKLLIAAGPAAVVAALGVCNQWRRVALGLIGRISRVDLGKMYTSENGGRKSPPTYRQLLQVLYQFPGLRTLVIRNWLYQDIMEDVVSYICTNFESQSLTSVEFSDVCLRSTDLKALMHQCPKLERIRLESHLSINDALLKSFASAYPAIDKQAGRGVRSIILARCSYVRREGVSQILQHVKPASLTITSCNDLRRLHWTSTRGDVMEKLTVTNCNNLNECLIHIPDGKQGVSELNLSQCPKLCRIRISGRSEAFQLGLRKLNLSGCGSLSEWEQSDVGDTHRFENLEELILFGVSKLSHQFFASIFGLDSTGCCLPSLRRLDITGGRISTLKLIGYESLVSVDVPGCQELTDIEIRNSWRLERLNVTGRKAPLRSVNLILPAMCVVHGKRRQWHWEGYDSNQSILYP